MAFNPGLSIGQILKNADIVEKFKCGNMGGMRRSKTTDTLVIVSTRRVSTTISGSVAYFIIPVWVKTETKILTGPRMLLLQVAVITVSMYTFLRL